MATIEIVRGSLLDQDVEAIVNAANTSMRGGSGLDGQVHRLAGKGLIEELMRVAPHRCRTGKVIVTGGQATPFRYILHTPGPVWRGGISGEEALLADCYRNATLKAQDLGVRTLGFASISTGIYRYPLERAATLALRVVRETVTTLERVVFAMYGAEEYEAFLKAFR
ncbi:MAG: macro domain-containing protein [Fimbriimonas sp.]